jgi:hypothetical protein
MDYAEEVCGCTYAVDAFQTPWASGRCGKKEMQESSSTKRPRTIKSRERLKMRQPFGSQRELNIYLDSCSILDFSFFFQRPLALPYGL